MCDVKCVKDWFGVIINDVVVVLCVGVLWCFLFEYGVLFEVLLVVIVLVLVYDKLD